MKKFGGNRQNDEKNLVEMFFFTTFALKIK